MSTVQSASAPTDDCPSDRFVDRPEFLRTLERARGQGCGIAVVHFDLDRFHHVNMRWGQTTGDRVLSMLGPRLAEHLPWNGVVAAAEGDSYLALFTDIDERAAADAAADLLEVVRLPIVLGSVRLTLGATAGLAYREAGAADGDLLEQAYLACRRGKSLAPGTVVGYEASLAVEASHRHRTEDGLLRALAQGELRLHLQPEVDLHDGRVVGVEALVRWAHPEDGLLPPSEFLPVAEQAGLMVAIGDWVLDEAIRHAERWQTLCDGAPMRIWVNLAAQQLAGGERFVDRVRGVLASGRITARSLGFEVTESTLLEDLPSAVGVLTSLRELGVEIALDDFGTGYSSLTYLRQLPVSAVKIDRTFVAGIGGSLADEAIVEAVIDLAHALGLRVVAEGVEDLHQAEALVRMGADQAQGFFFGRPQLSDELEPKAGLPWCGQTVPELLGTVVDRRADELPGYGSPRARLLLAALDSAHDSIIVTSARVGGALDAPIVYVNAAFEAETGYRSRDVIGRTVEVLLTDSPGPEVRGWFDAVGQDVRAATTELANRRADGSTFLCELTLSPIADERGVLTHWLHVRRDLTQRRAAEGDRARFEGLIEQSTSLVFLAETGGRWLYANAAQRAALGLALDAPLDDLRSEDLLSEEQIATYDAEVGAALEAGGRWSGATTFADRTSGRVTSVEMDLQMVDDPLRPGIRVFAGVSRDVTEVRRLADAERRRSDLAEFASALARRALDVGNESLLADLDQLLAELAALLSADLAFVDEIDLDAGVLRPRGGWVSERWSNRPAPPAEVPLDQVQSWVARMQARGVIIDISDGEQAMPWDEELETVFSSNRASSTANVPLRVGDVLLGVLGVGCSDAARSWTQDEIDLVQGVADALANLLHRQRAERAVRASKLELSAMLANVGDVLVVVDRDGLVRSANERSAAVLGVDPDTAVGRHFLEIVHPDDHAIAVGLYAQSLAIDGSAPRMEIRASHCDGSTVWLEADSTRVSDPLIGGVMIALRDVSERRARAASVNARLAALLDGSLDLVVVVDEEARIQYANGTVERVLGYTQDQVVGASFADFVHPDDLEMAFEEFTFLIEEVETDLATVRLVQADGSAGWWEIRTGVIRDPVGGGFMLTLRDVTMEREAAAEAAARVEHLRYAFDIAQSALDLDADEFVEELGTVCSDIGEILGVDFVYVDQLDESRQLLVNLAGWVGASASAQVRPGHTVPFTAIPHWVERLRSGVPVVAHDPSGTDESWVLEKRENMGSEGAMVAVGMSAAKELFGVLGVSMQDSARRWTDDEVTFLRIVAETIAYVLERRRLDHALRDSEARFRLLSETAADVVLLLDAAGEIVYASPSSFDLIGYRPDELAGKNFQSLVHPDDLAHQLEGARELRRGRRFISEARLLRWDGSVVWVASSASSVFDPDTGLAIEYRVSVRDLTDRKRLEAELEQQALHDPVTGLANRIMLRSHLEVATSRRGVPNHVSVLLLDLDGFKEVNDTHGHAVGDELLGFVAERLSSLTRPSDTLARTGGDEFVLLCPDTELDGAVTIAERIVERLGRPFSVGGVDVSISASVGVAHHDGAMSDPDWLLIEADHAMYTAKRSGKSCVRVAGSAAPVVSRA